MLPSIAYNQHRACGVMVAFRFDSQARLCSYVLTKFRAVRVRVPSSPPPTTAFNSFRTYSRREVALIRLFVHIGLVGSSVVKNCSTSAKCAAAT